MESGLFEKFDNLVAKMQEESGIICRGAYLMGVRDGDRARDLHEISC